MQRSALHTQNLIQIRQNGADELVIIAGVAVGPEHTADEGSQQHVPGRSAALATGVLSFV